MTRYAILYRTRGGLLELTPLAFNNTDGYVKWTTSDFEQFTDMCRWFERNRIAYEYRFIAITL